MTASSQGVRSIGARSNGVVVALMLVLVGGATERASAEGKLKTDPRSEKVFRAMCDFYAAAQTIGVVVEDEKRTPPPDQGMDCLQTPWTHIAVEFARPNRVLCMIRTGHDVGMARVSDGRELTLYSPRFNKYAVEPAPEGVAEALGFFQSPWLDRLSPTMSQGLQQVAHLFAARPYEDFAEWYGEIRYVGEETLGDPKTRVRVHRLRLVAAQHEVSELEVLIDAGKEPVLRRIQHRYPTIKTADGKPLVSTTEFWGWTFVAKPDDEAYRFELPPDAKRSNAESLFRLFDEQPRDLLGKPARDCDLKLMAGRTTKLADHKGKDVVVLYFWETWNPQWNYNYAKTPAEVAAVAAAFRGQGCTFYAVNYEQSLAEIRSFMKEQKLDFPVVVDRSDAESTDPDGEGGIADRAARRAFAVDELPTVIVVGKDGEVKVVHELREFIGRSPPVDFSELLRSELRDVLAGKQPTSK